MSQENKAKLKCEVYDLIIKRDKLQLEYNDITKMILNLNKQIEDIKD